LFSRFAFVDSFCATGLSGTHVPLVPVVVVVVVVDAVVLVEVLPAAVVVAEPAFLPLPFDLVVETLVVEVAVDFALGPFAFVIDDFGALAFGPLVLTVVVVVLRPDGA
jgi:hypothetical protein